MNITRVERDGVEFFTIDATGESGMSEVGLARLCGVSQQGINSWLKSIKSLITSNSDQNDLYRLLGGNICLQAKGLNTVEKSKIRNLSIVRAEACAWSKKRSAELLLHKLLHGRSISSEFCSFLRYLSLLLVGKYSRPAIDTGHFDQSYLLSNF